MEKENQITVETNGLPQSSIEKSGRAGKRESNERSKKVPVCLRMRADVCVCACVALGKSDSVICLISLKYFDQKKTQLSAGEHTIQGAKEFNRSAGRVANVVGQGNEVND